MNANSWFFPLSALINAITSFFLGIVVFKQNLKSSLHRSYFLFCFSVAFWSLFYFIWQISSTKESALFFSRALMVGAIFIPFFYFHHVTIFLNKSQKYRLIIFLGYLICIFNIVFSFHPLFISKVVQTKDFKFWPIAGPLYYPFIIFWGVYVVAGIVLLCRAFPHTRDVKRNQLLYVLIATFVGWTGGATNFPMWFGFELSPYGNIFVAFYIAIVSYAIIKHHLMNIEIIIKRTAVFAGLFTFVYGTLAFATIAGQEFFKKTLGWSQWLSLVPSILIITFCLRPLEIFLTEITEKFLFQKKYDYRDLLKTFINETLTVLDLQKLMQETVNSLVKIVKLESAAVLLRDRELGVYTLVASSGVSAQIDFTDNDLFISYLKKTNHPILKDKSVDQMDSGELKESFEKLNAQLCIPIQLHDNLIGVLCLGSKKSGEDYTQEDIDILTTLSRTEAIAISNAQLFDELSKTQAEAAQREKMAVIGTLAAGINHEICNPLGIVRGQCEMFLLNNRDGFYAGKSADEVLQISSDIMAKVIKETDRATAITKKLSGFAKPSKVIDLDTVMVEKELDEVMALIGHELELDNITIEKKFTENFPAITADRKQIQEVLFNIIRNAAQAMDRKEGHVLVSGVCENNHVTIKISDNGSGIPPEKIGQIFNPFYTTKAPGKGTGLGLFIVRQVVERNKGSIAVESEVGAGTTFTLRFPAAHPDAAKVV